MRFRVTKWIVVAGLAVAQTGCIDSSATRDPDAGTSAAPATIEIGVPGRANANVSIASAGAFTMLVWSAAEPGGATDIYAAVSRDGGRNFGDPVRVNSEAGSASVSGEQPPRIALGAQEGNEPVVSVIWTAQGAAGTTLMTSQSQDGGRSYSDASLVAGTGAPGNRGWESLAAFDDGHVVSIWLDHRQLADNKNAALAHPHHGTELDGVAMAQRSQLYFAGLDAGIAPRPLTGGVCYCCKTALATGVLNDANTVAAAWRHVYPGNMRDIAFTLSRDRGRTFSEPARVSEDHWSIAGCPDDGPAMAVDGAGRVHLVWPTAVSENGQPVKALFHAMTADGVTFSPRVRVPTEGQANHPQIASAPDGSLAVIWDESGSGSRRIAFAVGRMDTEGDVRFERRTLGGEVRGVYPIVAASDGGHLAAWTSGPADRSMIRLMRLSR